LAVLLVYKQKLMNVGLGTPALRKAQIRRFA